MKTNHIQYFMIRFHTISELRRLILLESKNLSFISSKKIRIKKKKIYDEDIRNVSAQYHTLRMTRKKKREMIRPN